MYTKGGMNCLYYVNINWTFIQTTGGHTRNTPGCIFPCFLCFGARNASLELWCHFWHCHVHTMMLLAWKQCHLVVGHTFIYILSKFEVNWTDGSQVTAIFVSSPCFSWSDHYQTIQYLKHGLRTNPTTTHHSVCPCHSWHHCKCADG